jgi:acetaldehyde dehydrogenase (acetylating)
MTLGCGGFGGNITSDNISPKHLLNIKRIAYETKPLSQAARAGSAGDAGTTAKAAKDESSPRLPQAPAKPVPEPIAADTLTRRIDAFLSSRGIAQSGSSVSQAALPAQPAQPAPPGLPAPPAQSSKPAEFVCEDDVRQAAKNGQKILVGDKTIITPAARDAGEAAKVFTWQSYP